MLEVYVDFKSPTSYLALKPTRELVSELDSPLIWRALKTTQHTVPDIQADEDQGTSHRRVRAQARQNSHLHYANVQSLPMRFPARFCETDLALCVLDALSELSIPAVDAYVTVAFKAYWEDHLDLDDTSVVAQMLDDCKIDATLIDKVRQDLPGRLDSIANSALEQGVVDAPAYLVGGQVFIGREHLPWVRQFLSASS